MRYYLLAWLIFIACMPGGAQTIQLYTCYDIDPGPYNSHPRGFTHYNGKFVFTAHHVAYGDELWIGDGTMAGTYMIKDIDPQEVSWNLRVSSISPPGMMLQGMNYGLPTAQQSVRI